MHRIAPWLVAAVVLSLSLVWTCVCRGQVLDFKVEGPTEVTEGEYVELTVKFPEGVKADVDFVPVEETNFGVHPIVSETVVKGKLVPEIVGKTCTFSARCAGEREIVVVATAFASFDGVPRLKSLKHRIAVKSNKAPNPSPPPKEPPADPPPPKPPGDDDLGPKVPFPSADAPKSDVEKITLILDNVMDRIEALEKRSTQVSVAREPVDKGNIKPSLASDPASMAMLTRIEQIRTEINAPDTSAPPAVKATPVAVDARAGHWSVGSDWTPTKAEAIAHLRQTHPSKAKQHEPLESLSLDSILTLHDDAHEGRVSTVRSSTVVSTPAPVKPAPVRYVQPASACPGGFCPTSSRSSYTTGPLGFRWRR